MATQRLRRTSNACLTNDADDLPNFLRDRSTLTDVSLIFEGFIQ